MSDTYNWYGHIVELDDDTGLPVLPEGYFWRVKRNRMNGWPLMNDWPLDVQVRRKTWFGSILVHWINCNKWTDAEILHQAAQCAALHLPGIIGPEDKRLLGDYPTKKHRRHQMTKSMAEVQKDLVAYTYEQALSLSALQKALGDDEVGDVEAYASKHVSEMLAASEETAREAEWPEVVTHAFCAGMITTMSKMLEEIAESQGLS